MPGKSTQCGNNMAQESSEPLEYAGIIPILNKVIEISSKYPFWGKVDVYSHYLSSGPLIEVITDMENPSLLSVQINEVDLKQKNLVSNFKALYTHGGLTSKWESDAQYKWVTVNDPKVAAKIVYEILTKVYQKDPNSARFVITEVDGNDTDKATYNSSGEFITGIGYGKGEFANYKQPKYLPNAQEYNEINRNYTTKIVLGVIAVIAIGFLSNFASSSDSLYYNDDNPKGHYEYQEQKATTSVKNEYPDSWMIGKWRARAISEYGPLSVTLDIDKYGNTYETIIYPNGKSEMNSFKMCYDRDQQQLYHKDGSLRIIYKVYPSSRQFGDSEMMFSKI